jgi:hypothetical protein
MQQLWSSSKPNRLDRSGEAILPVFGHAYCQWKTTMGDG